MAANRALACVDDVGPLGRRLGLDGRGQGRDVVVGRLAPRLRLPAEGGVGELVGRRLPARAEGEVEHVAPHGHHATTTTTTSTRPGGPRGAGRVGGGGGHRASLATAPRACPTRQSLGLGLAAADLDGDRRAAGRARRRRPGTARSRSPAAWRPWAAGTRVTPKPAPRGRAVASSPGSPTTSGTGWGGPEPGSGGGVDEGPRRWSWWWAPRTRDGGRPASAALMNCCQICAGYEPPVTVIGVCGGRSGICSPSGPSSGKPTHTAVASCGCSRRTRRPGCRRWCRSCRRPGDRAWRGCRCPAGSPARGCS